MIVRRIEIFKNGEWIGCAQAYGVSAYMDEMELCLPHIEDYSLRFYFTPRGWKDIGTQIISYLNGEYICDTLCDSDQEEYRVIESVIEDYSIIAYRDEDQIAINPHDLEKISIAA